MKEKYIKRCFLWGILLLILISFIFFICKNKETVKNTMANKFTNNCKLTHIKNKTFELDDETSYLSSYIQFIDKDSISYFTFINEYNNSIYFYNYKTSSYLNRIRYEKEGNNGVGRIQGYYYVNSDTIYTYAHRGHKVYVTNNQSHVIGSSSSLYEKVKYYDLDDIVSFPPSPYLQTDNPIRVLGENVILAGYIGGEYMAENDNNRPVNILYNFSTDTVRYANNYPDFYQKFNWGGGLTYRLPHFETHENEILLSFSADHYVKKYSLDNNSYTNYYAGSSLIDEIKPFPYPKVLPINKDKAWDWYMDNPSYEGIYYDKYKKIYYRIARLKNKDYVKNEIGNRKPVVVIILDKELKYIGECKLPLDMNLRTSNCFVSEDGLNIQLLDNNENYFTFSQFNIEILK